MAAQFPSICYIKGVYAAQSNLRISQRRLAWSSQDCMSTRKKKKNQRVPMFFYLLHPRRGASARGPVGVYAAAAFQNASKFLSLVRAAHDTSDEFLSAASIRICLHLYVKLALRCVLISISCTSSCSQEVESLRVLVTDFFS